MAKSESCENINKTFKCFWCCLKKNQKVLWQKNPIKHHRRRKQKYKAYFKGETGVFGIKKLSRDIIEGCKLPAAKKLRKKLGYNDDDIMVSD